MYRCIRNGLASGCMLAFVISSDAWAHRVYLNDINDQLTPQQEAELRRIIDHQVAFHKQALDIYEPLFVPVKIFPKLSHYQRYRGSADRMSGHYSNVIREIVLYKAQPNYIGTLYHEAQHLVFAAGKVWPPIWLNEGLSEVYENAEFRGDKLVSLQSNRQKKLLLRWLDEGTLPDVGSYMALSRESWMNLRYEPERISYTMAWGLVYFLMSSEMGRQSIIDTIRYIKERDERFSGVIYPGGIKAFDRDFRAFLRNMPEELVI